MGLFAKWLPAGVAAASPEGSPARVGVSRRWRAVIAGLVGLGSLAGVLVAQQVGRSPAARVQAQLAPDPNDRNGVPDWGLDPQFKKDVFTFVRVRWHSWRSQEIPMTDFPDSELNFSFRLQQLTTMKVNPQPKVLELTDEELFDYPFVYMLEVGSLQFSDEEVVALRRYLENGGFLMVDDFWGEYAWRNFYQEIKRVFPDKEPTELPLEHPIFHNVYDLKEKPQVPGIDTAREFRGTNVTWERSDAKEPHYRGIFDDKGRLMVIICHNTDLGDAWEREGEEEWYFHQFSEKKAYPMGINIIFYAMTH